MGKLRRLWQWESGRGSKPAGTRRPVERRLFGFTDSLAAKKKLSYWNAGIAGIEHALLIAEQ